MDKVFENIIPWNGDRDTGRDVRMKWERNFRKIGLNFSELEGKFGTVDELLELIAEELETKLSKIEPDSAQELITFLEGLTSDGFVEANSGLIVRSSKKTISLSNALIEDSNKDSISHDLIEEEDNAENLSTSLLEVDMTGGTIGSLDNVDPQADTALIGSLLAKGSESWAPIAPVQSGLTDYEHMLIPVFHTIRQQWFFIPADRFGEVVPPVSSGFPYVLPLTLL